MTDTSKYQESDRWRIFWWAILGLLFMLSHSQPMIAQTDETDRRVIEKILSDWRTRQQKIFSIHYKLSGRAMHAKGRFQNDKYGILPAKTFFCDTKVEWLVDFRTNRSRKNSRAFMFYSGINEFFPSFSVDVCVDKYIKSYSPRDKNVIKGDQYSQTQPDLVIANSTSQAAYFGLEGTPLFFAHGRVPTRKHPLDPIKLNNGYPTADHFDVRGRTLFQDQECVILREKPRHSLENIFEYWVNPRRKSIILRRRVIFLPAHVDSQSDVSYKKHSVDWLPEEIALTYFGPKGDVQYSQNLQVTLAKVNIDFSDDQFQINLNPGERILDLPSGKQLFKVQENGTWAPYHPYTGDTLRTTRIVWLVIGAVVLIVLLIGILSGCFYYRARQPNSQPLEDST